MEKYSRHTQKSFRKMKRERIWVMKDRVEEGLGF